MICRKCKASVDENDKYCKHCGAKLHVNDNMRKIVGLVLLIVCVCAVTVAILYMNRSPSEGDGVAVTESTEQPGTEASPEASASVQPEESEPISDTGRNLEETWVVLKEICVAANEYVESYNLQSPFISLNAYLYDTSAARAVNVEDLVDTSKLELDESYREEKVFFLYARPADFAGFNELDFSSRTDLEIFVACETVTGVALYSANNSGVMYRESLNTLIESYNMNHGDITRLVSANADYEAIMEVIRAYEYNENGYDARYLAADEKYAYAVVSDKTDSSTIYNYVLEKRDGVFTVLADGLEGEQVPICTVNNAAPDFNLEMMPPYNIKRVSLQPSVAFEYMANSLQDAGEITEEDMPVKFLSGTDEYVYIVFSSGKAFFGRYSSDTGWAVAPAEDWAEVEIAIRLAEATNPPTYILRQE